VLFRSNFIHHTFHILRLPERFKPAQQDGLPVAVWVQVPIRFTLH
jgi:hypothetical protein